MAGAFDVSRFPGLSRGTPAAFVPGIRHRRSPYEMDIVHAPRDNQIEREGEGGGERVWEWRGGRVTRVTEKLRQIVSSRAACLAACRVAGVQSETGRRGRGCIKR